MQRRQIRVDEATMFASLCFREKTVDVPNRDELADQVDVRPHTSRGAMAYAVRSSVAKSTDGRVTSTLRDDETLHVATKCVIVGAASSPRRESQVRLAPLLAVPSALSALPFLTATPPPPLSLSLS